MSARNARERTYRAFRAGHPAHVTHVRPLGHVHTCVPACTGRAEGSGQSADAHRSPPTVVQGWGRVARTRPGVSRVTREPRLSLREQFREPTPKGVSTLVERVPGDRRDSASTLNGNFLGGLARACARAREAVTPVGGSRLGRNAIPRPSPQSNFRLSGSKKRFFHEATHMTDQNALLTEIEHELNIACRRAWRQLVPNWRDLEAETVLLLATVAVTRRRPDLDDAGAMAELQRLGIVTASGLVRVPMLPGEPLPPTGGVQ